MYAFRDGYAATYKSGPALLGGYVTWLFDLKDRKLAVEAFDKLSTAKRWGRRMCYDPGTHGSRKARKPTLKEN